MNIRMYDYENCNGNCNQCSCSPILNDGTQCRHVYEEAKHEHNMENNADYRQGYERAMGEIREAYAMAMKKANSHKYRRMLAGYLKAFFGKFMEEV